MKFLTTALMLSILVPITSFAGGVDYGNCQKTLNKMFEGKKSMFGGLKAVIKIDDKGNLVSNSKNLEIQEFNIKTGLHVFKEVKSGKTFRYITKKDVKERLSSISCIENCYSNTNKIEIAYSKNTCLPKRVYETDENKVSQTTVDLEACKSIKDIKKKFFKNLRNAKTCRNNLRDMYKKAANVADYFAESISTSPRSPDLAHDLNPSEDSFVTQLSGLSSKSKKLTANLDDTGKLGDIEVEAQDHFTDIIARCNNFLGKSLVNSNSVFEKNGNVFEIKTGRKSRTPKVKKGNKGKGI